MLGYGNLRLSGCLSGGLSRAHLKNSLSVFPRKTVPDSDVGPNGIGSGSGTLVFGHMFEESQASKDIREMTAVVHRQGLPPPGVSMRAAALLGAYAAGPKPPK